MNPPALNRRKFLLHLARISSAAALAAPANALAAISAPRRLNFLHTHTREKLDVVYYADGQYLPEARTAITQFLRDHRTDEAHPIDPALFDILHEVSRLGEGNRCFEVISGYRSPATNNRLRRHSRGVARNSLHMQGKAIDVRLQGVNTRTLRQLAIALRQGGVGYYRSSDFVHLDTGKFRTW